MPATKRVRGRLTFHVPIRYGSKPVDQPFLWAPGHCGQEIPHDRHRHQGLHHWDSQPPITALLNLALIPEARAGLLFLVLPNATPEVGK